MHTFFLKKIQTKKYFGVGLLLFLFPFILVAQSYEFEIYDEASKAVIPYANISIIGLNTGVTCSEKGICILTLQTSNDSLLFSCIGYTNQKIAVSDLSLATQNKIFLKPAAYNLDAVVITPPKGKQTIILNNRKKKDFNTFFGLQESQKTTGREIAMFFMPPNQSKQWFIKSIKYFTYAYWEKGTTKFRVKVYDINTNTGLPNKELLKEAIYVETEKRKTFLTVDLAPHQIKVPSTGCFVAIEWLIINENYYNKEVSIINRETQKTTMKTMEGYRPHLGCYKIEKTEQKTYIKDYEQKWSKFGLPLNLGISLVLTD